MIFHNNNIQTPSRYLVIKFLIIYRKEKMLYKCMLIAIFLRLGLFYFWALNRLQSLYRIYRRSDKLGWKITFPLKSQTGIKMINFGLKIVCVKCVFQGQYFQIFPKWTKLSLLKNITVDLEILIDIFVFVLFFLYEMRFILFFN